MVVPAAGDGVVQAPVLHKHPADNPQLRQESDRAEHRGPASAPALAQEAVHGEMVALLQYGSDDGAPGRRHPVAAGLQAESDILKGRDDTWYH